LKIVVQSPFLPCMPRYGVAARMRERNTELRRTLTALLLCLLAVLAIHHSLRAAGATDEMRALWVRQTTLETEESIRRMVASASTSGFNTLFVQIGNEAATAAQTFDPVAETINQAHAAGLRVHAWLDIARVAPSGELPFARDHVIYQHPEWLMVPRAIAAELPVDVHSPDYLGRLVRWTRSNTDRIDGLYVSPALPEVASYLAEAVRDVVRRYPLDGVYLDHMRYPGADFDYGGRSIAAFRDMMKGQLSLTERQRIDSVQALDPFAYPNELPDEWRSFRRAQLTALVVRLRSTVKSVRPGTTVSVAVTADAESAERENLQDWRTWAANEFIDALCPMVAGADVTGQLSQIRELAAGRPFWAGIGANRLSQRETIDGIAAARRAGAQGIVLFSYDSLISPPKGSEFLTGIGRGAFAGS
jgi:uncharacterized lipoprotein YddW (UPF0748 family)